MKIDLNKYLDLTFLLELKDEDWHIDLHNDYEAIEIKLNNSKLEICFERILEADYEIVSSFGKVSLVFENIITELDDIQKILFEKGALDNLNFSFSGGYYTYVIGFQYGEEYEFQCSTAYFITSERAR